MCGNENSLCQPAKVRTSAHKGYKCPYGQIKKNKIGENEKKKIKSDKKRHAISI